MSGRRNGPRSSRRGHKRSNSRTNRGAWILIQLIRKEIIDAINALDQLPEGE